jgi:lipopolysaccharide biosynthesis glycosyltransferase
LPLQRINIVLAFDDGYAQHACVTLMSLFETNPGADLCTYLLVPEDFTLASKIETSLARYGRDVHFVFASMSSLESVAIHDAPGRVLSQWSKAAYLRLLIGDLLPADQERAIYLDSDIVVCGDVLPLWRCGLGDRVIGAVPCRFAESHQDWFRERLEMDEQAIYFNSGVLLIDLMKWRAQEIGPRALKFLALKPDKVTNPDQCALNHVINGRYCILHREWNFQDAMIGQQSDRTPKIIHFNGDRKPWHYMCSHPERFRYLNYLAQTEWKNYVFPDRSLLNVIKRAVRTQVPWIVQVRRRIWTKRSEIPPWDIR